MNQLLAFLAILLLSPLFVLVGVLIAIIDGLPVFFNQKRLGEDKKIFVVHKFRTMSHGEITFLGKILRKTGIDELPQLINIAKNEMSFIGPRPLTAFDVERLGWHADYYATRWDVKPGITGLAQLSPICHKKVSFFLDKYYATKQSVCLDAKIIIISALVIFLGKQKGQKIFFKR